MMAADDAGPEDITVERAAITGYGPPTFPDLTTIDEQTVLETDLGAVEPHVLITRALALCYSWRSVQDRDAAIRWLSAAVPALEPEGLVDFNDVALASGEFLADAAPMLEAAWASISEDTSTRGNVALEGWVRLALGGWTNGTLKLRGALSARASEASTECAAADPYLVRSLGAALDQWADTELETALEQLAGNEDVECDIAFELGMSQLRRAVQSTDSPVAVQALERAVELFAVVTEEGDRPDAVAFGTACTAVSRFLQGESVTAADVSSIQSAVSEWYLGYLGLVPHWRQSRAETGGAWAALLVDLNKVSDLHQTTWMEPMRLLADVGSIYLSHNCSQLIANPASAPAFFPDLVLPVTNPHAETAPVMASGVAVALGPALDAGLAATAHSRDLVDRWLASVAEQATAPPPDTVAAITAARDRIRSAPPPSGKAGASRDDRLPEEVREALKEAIQDDDLYETVVDAVQPLIEVEPELASGLPEGLGSRPLTLAEQGLLRNLCGKLAAVLPEEFRVWSPHLNLLIATLIRVVRLTINQEQGGKRALPWHSQVALDKKPQEHLLADYLAHQLTFAGLEAHVEVPNSGGGRADVLVPIDTETFVIEVKRITAHRTDDELTDEYGPQASQYTLAGAPFAFLAVLDTNHHESRFDLNHSFWVGTWPHPELDVERPVLGLRVLSDVPSPSGVI